MKSKTFRNIVLGVIIIIAISLVFGVGQSTFVSELASGASSSVSASGGSGLA